MYRKIFALSLLAAILTGCASEKQDAQEPNPASVASMCEILKQQISESNYQDYDEATMKRKNAGDQARMMQEYNSYGCPAIVEQIERPNPSAQ